MKPIYTTIPNINNIIKIIKTKEDEYTGNENTKA